MRISKVKPPISLAIFLLATCWLLPALVFPLPKDQKAPLPTNIQPTEETQQPATARPIPANPIPVFPNDVSLPNPPKMIPLPGDDGSEPEYRSLAPNAVGATTVPFIDVIPGGGTGSIGTVEFPQNNNYMRDFSVHLVGGNAVVHMGYPIYTGTNSSPWQGTTADSNQSRVPVFYNSYNCGGSGTLDYPAPGIRMSQVFPDLAPDDRRREIGSWGPVLNFTEAGQKTVVYGNRFIQATEFGAYAWWFRGTGFMQDSAECAGRFSMTGADTSMIDETDGALGGIADPVMRAINESTWVATYTSAIGDANQVLFNYTTDRGETWTNPIVSRMKTSWWNATEIASNGGDVFYLVGATNPANPSTFWQTERPCYVKGTYNPATGNISFGPLTDITGNFELPLFLTIPHQVQAVMVGTTLHCVWTDWNNYNGQGFPGPGGHVHHASVAADGSVSGPHKIANINIDGRLPDRSSALFGFASGPWGSGLGLSYDAATNILYAIWSQPREQYDVNGAPTLQWDDPWGGIMANFDIYYSASNNGGLAWDDPVNLTDTKNADCLGTAASPCVHEDYFAAYPEVVNDTVWILSLTRPKPGFRQAAIYRHSGDPGSFQIMTNKIRLYKAPARPVVPSVRAELLLAPGDTTDLNSIFIPPRGWHTVTLTLANLGTVGFFVDSITVDPSLDEAPADPDGLNVIHIFDGGTYIDVGGSLAGTLLFDASQVPVRASGTRRGLLRAYCHTSDPSVSPPNNADVAILSASVNVITSYCLNRQIRIHSVNNSTDVGSQGSIADEAGTNGLFYDSDESNRFYDGGVWIANSELNGGDCYGDFGDAAPRRVTRQIFGDEFLRCIADGELDSVPIGGGAYNLYVRSVGTDVADSSLIWLNLWEQSTHIDSSDWLVQNIRMINASENSIDSVAMGVLYDIDVLSSISTPARNVGGDTIILGVDGRYYHLGWIGGNDVSRDTCSPNTQLYGFIVIPDPLNPPPVGDTVEPRFASVYRATAFAYNLNCYGSYGDSLAQRWSWTGTGFYSTNGRVRFANRSLSDRWTYEYNDTLADADTCLDGRLWRADMGYMTIAKKVYNFPTNIGAREAIGRYGLGGLAASVDTFFRGSGESYSVIHIGSVTGLPGLINNAKRATKWFWDHAALQIAPTPSLPWLRGDLNRTGITGASNPLSAADIVATLLWIFNDENRFGGILTNPLIPLCAVDINGDGAASASDVVALLNGMFNALNGINPSSVCPLCLTSCL